MTQGKYNWTLPSPLEIAILLTFIVFTLCIFLTDTTVVESLIFWGDGMWSLIGFMTQMCLILLGGFVLAISPPVNRILRRAAALPKTPVQTYFFVFFISAMTCWLNWGLGLVAGAVFAKEVSQGKRDVHFPLVVAVSYMGFLFWHGGLSGSIPLVVSTPGSFSEKWMDLIPFAQTVFSSLNLIIIGCVFLGLSILILTTVKRMSAKTIVSLPKDTVDGLPEEVRGESSIVTLVASLAVILLCVSYFLVTVYKGTFGFGLNQVNLLLFTLGVIFHGGLESYMLAVRKGMDKLAPILVQYPQYAGIMGMMVQSGLATQISQAFVAVSTKETYPMFMFLSAGLVNLFVPSGGGQWAVQSPVVIEGAKVLNVPLSKVVMAVAWGDAWTNLVQPFWALPLLSIVNLKIQDILGYCFKALIVSGIGICLCFYFL